MTDVFVNRAKEVSKGINTLLLIHDISLEMEQVSEQAVQMILRCTETGEKIPIEDAINQWKEPLNVRTSKSESRHSKCK